MNKFVEYTGKSDSGGAAEYRKTQLNGAQRASFPSTDTPLVAETSDTSGYRVFNSSIDFVRKPISSTTPPPTLISTNLPPPPKQ